MALRDVANCGSALRPRTPSLLISAARPKCILHRLSLPPSHPSSISRQHHWLFFFLSREVNVIMSRSLFLSHSPVLSLSYQVSVSHPPSSRAQNRAAAIFFLLLQSRAALCFKMSRLFRATCLFFLFKSHWLNTLSTARYERNFFLLFLGGR